jgi:nitrate reductase gamma subunit
MIFNAILYTALLIFLLGLIYRVSRWFFKYVGTGDRDIAVSRRIASGLKGVAAVIFSAKVFSLVKVLIVNVLLQFGILKDKKDPLVWIMHLLIFVGFAFLLLFHALGDHITVAVFPDYQPTLNPFMFLRNLSGMLVLTGLVLAIIRRSVVLKGGIKTTGMDLYAIAILAVIIGSGFLLESLKITSRAEFDDMVADYSGIDDPADKLALESYWVEKFGLVSPNVHAPVSSQTLAKGLELHETNCWDCHSRPQSAFIAYPLSRLIKPVALHLDRIDARTVVRYIHFLACFLGLALLAFSKLFHIFSTPVSLVVAEVSQQYQDPVTVANRQMLEMDGCRHGGACHEQCPVRKRRMERIAQSAPYEPMLTYAGEKSADKLGSRAVSS